MFADDTALLCSGCNREKLEIYAFITLQTAVQFLSNNDLITNEDKSSVVGFTNKYDNHCSIVNVIIGDKVIDQSSCVKFLGIYVFCTKDGF